MSTTQIQTDAATSTTTTANTASTMSSGSHCNNNNNNNTEQPQTKRQKIEKINKTNCNKLKSKAPTTSINKTAPPPPDIIDTGDPSSTVVDTNGQHLCSSLSSSAHSISSINTPSSCCASSSSASGSLNNSPTSTPASSRASSYAQLLQVNNNNNNNALPTNVPAAATLFACSSTSSSSSPCTSSIELSSSADEVDRCVGAAAIILPDLLLPPANVAGGGKINSLPPPLHALLPPPLLSALPETNANSAASAQDMREFEESLTRQCLCGVSERTLRKPFQSHYSLDAHTGHKRIANLAEWPTEKLLQFLSNLQLLFDIYLKQNSKGFICARIMDVCDALIRNDHNLIDEIIVLAGYSNAYVQFLAGRVLASFLVIAKQEMNDDWLKKLVDNLFNFERLDHVAVQKIHFSLEIIKRIVEWKDVDQHPLEDEIAQTSSTTTTLSTAAGTSRGGNAGILGVGGQHASNAADDVMAGLDFGRFQTQQPTLDTNYFAVHFRDETPAAHIAVQQAISANSNARRVATEDAEDDDYYENDADDIDELEDEEDEEEIASNYADVDEEDDDDDVEELALAQHRRQHHYPHPHHHHQQHQRQPQQHFNVGAGSSAFPTHSLLLPTPPPNSSLSVLQPAPAVYEHSSGSAITDTAAASPSYAYVVGHNHSTPALNTAAAAVGQFSNEQHSHLNGNNNNLISSSSTAAVIMPCHIITLTDSESFDTTHLKCITIKILENKWPALVKNMSALIAQHLAIENAENCILNFLQLWENIISVKANLSIVETLPFYAQLDKFELLLNQQLSCTVYKQMLCLFNEALCYGSTLALQDMLPNETCQLAHQIVRHVKDYRILESLPRRQPENNVGLIGFKRSPVVYDLAATDVNSLVADYGGNSSLLLSSSLANHDDVDVVFKMDKTILQKMVLLVLKSIAVTVKEIRSDSSDSSIDSNDSSDAFQDMILIERSIRDVLRKLESFIKHKLELFPEYHFSKILIHLFDDQDDHLIEAMVCTLDVTRSFRNNAFPELVAMLNPVYTFLEFLHLTSNSPDLLLDLLVDNETCFLLYLMRFLKYIRMNWSMFMQSCHECQLPRRPDEPSTLDKAINVLVRLRLQISRLVSRQLYPYDISPVLRLLESCESLYEGHELS